MRWMLVAAMAVFVSGSMVSAHHSYAGFEQTPITVSVQVESLAITNPHSLIHVVADDGRKYVGVWPAPNALMRRGIKLEGEGSVWELLPRGQRVTMTGRVKRGDTELPMLVSRIEHPVRGLIWGSR